MINFDKLDPRILIANSLCYWLYVGNNGDLKKCIDFLQLINLDLDDTLRNVYQFRTITDIPLLYYYDLITHGYTNFQFDTEQEFEKEIEKTINQCHGFYPNFYK